MKTSLAIVLALHLAFAAPVAAQESRPAELPESAPAVVAPATALNNEAVALHDAGRFDDAIKLFRKAMAARKLTHPELPDAVIVNNFRQSLVGAASKQLDDFDFAAAERLLDEALALDPKSALVRAMFGLANMRQGYFDRALSFASEAVGADETSAFAHEVRGNVHYRLEDLDRALLDLQKAKDLAPKATHLDALIKKIEKERAVEGGMRSERTTHFVAKFGDDVDRAIASTILDWLEDAYSEIGLKLHFYPGGVLTAVLYCDVEFNAATDTHSWAGGLFDGKIRIPVKNFDRAREQLRATLVHEYTHYVVSNYTRHCPVWLNEGLAQWCEGRRAAAAKRALAQAKAAGTLKAFKSMGTSFASIRDPRAAQLAYDQSLSFVEWLIDKTSLDRVEELLRALKPKIKTDAAIESVFGRTLEELEAEWLESL